MNRDQILHKYYDNEAQELYKLVDKILIDMGYGWIPDKDKDNFYSIASEVFTQILPNFNDEMSQFKTYLIKCLQNKFNTEVRDWGRDKRIVNYNVKSDKNKNSNICVSIYDENDDGISLLEKISSGEEELYDERVQEFLNTLSKIQKRILELLMDGYSPADIKKKINISDKKYAEEFEQIKSFKNLVTIKTIFSEHNFSNMEETIMTTTQTAEKSKPMTYSIERINRRIEDHTIRFDHPLQRESDQWNPAMKGNLVSDILQGNPLPELVFAEQIINGIPVIWDLDGKQRCTNCYSFSNDGFKVSKNIRRWNIKYVAQVRDENGNPILDENGNPMSEYKEFDIRNKKFSQLPKELQDKFLEYTFKCDQYLNCDNEEIAYHIIRYNEGKPMTKSQKGITRIGKEFAAMIKSISAMPFFRETGAYTVKEASNGTLDRVVVESLMASKYLNDWKKDQEKICDYLKENASVEDFDDFEDMVTRLNSVMTDEASEEFNSKNSFLYFGLYARFMNSGQPDERFVDFVAEFARSLHTKEVDGVSYDKLCVNPKTGNYLGTKDKNIVCKKIDLMESLMNEYLDIRDKHEETNNNVCIDHVNNENDKFVEDFCKTDFMYEVNLSKSDIQEVAIDTLNNIGNAEEALFYANYANEWLLNSEDRQLAINKYVLPAIVMLVKYVYDMDKSDEYGIVALNKFLHSGEISDNVQKNYTGMIACAT